MRKLFVGQEPDLAAAYATGVSVLRLAREYGCSAAAVTSALLRVGVTIRREKLTAADKQQIIERYAAGETGYQLADAFGVSRPTIITALRRNGACVREPSKCHRRQPIVDTVFDVVTEESAYWTGMLMADGCIFPPNIINLTLTAGDKDHLLAFRSFVGATTALRETQPRPIISPRNGRSYGCRGLFTLAFRSTSIYTRLVSFGLTPRKSLTARVIGLEANRHFWRGVIDGDGTIGIYRGEPRIGLVGSHDLLQQFASFVHDYCPWVRASVRSDSRTGWQYSVTGMGGRMIVQHLYGNSTISLPRKLAAAKRVYDHSHGYRS